MLVGWSILIGQQLLSCTSCPIRMLGCNNWTLLPPSSSIQPLLKPPLVTKPFLTRPLPTRPLLTRPLPTLPLLKPPLPSPPPELPAMISARLGCLIRELWTSVGSGSDGWLSSLWLSSLWLSSLSKSSISLLLSATGYKKMKAEWESDD